MARDEERLSRAQEGPIVGGLPEVPGILAAIRLTPGLGVHLRGLADELLVNDFPGASIVRAEREMLATAVSAANDCFYCMDSHGAFATALLERTGEADSVPLIDVIKLGSSDGLDAKMQALLHIARTVRGNARTLDAADIAAAHDAGATDADVQLAVLIAAAFSMYNRMVEGFRATTLPTPDAYRARAGEIADHGYSDQRVTAVPGLKVGPDPMVGLVDAAGDVTVVRVRPDGLWHVLRASDDHIEHVACGLALKATMVERRTVQVDGLLALGRICLDCAQALITDG